MIPFLFYNYSKYELPLGNCVFSLSLLWQSLFILKLKSHSLFIVRMRMRNTSLHSEAEGNLIVHAFKFSISIPKAFSISEFYYSHAHAQHQLPIFYLYLKRFYCSAVLSLSLSRFRLVAFHSEAVDQVLFVELLQKEFLFGPYKPLFSSRVLCIHIYKYFKAILFDLHITSVNWNQLAVYFNST